VALAPSHAEVEHLDLLDDAAREEEVAGLEILALEPLHDEEPGARRHHSMTDVADDAGVSQLGEHFDLSLEALGVALVVLGHQLDGHRLARGAIAGAEHPAHAARPDLLLEFEAIV